MVLQRLANELAASTHAALHEQLLKGVLHGAFGDFKLRSYLLVGQALNQEAEDLQLSTVQRDPLLIIRMRRRLARRRRLFRRLRDDCS